MADSRKANDLSEWYASQYRDSVNVASLGGNSSFKKLVQEFPATTTNAKIPSPITGKQRMSNFLSLKLRYPLGPKGYTCLAMTATVGGHSAHYAYAYWRTGQENGPPEYICVSPTFESRDGEYRRRFIRYPVFMETYESLASILAPFEETILSSVGQSGLEIKSIVYPADASEQVVGSASKTRLPIVAFVVALVLDLRKSQKGGLMIHTSKGYVGLMSEFAKLHPELIKLSYKASSTAHQFVKFHRGSENRFTVQCGQKLVPMFMREAMQPHDFNLATWRELAITQFVGDLVINYVSPSFAIYNQWTYIEDTDSALFENRAMKERYARGRAVEESARSLREARRKLGDAGKSYHIEQLSARMYESIEQAQSYLLMSTTAMMHTMEDIGMPLRSVPVIIRQGLSMWPAIEDVFATPDESARSLFEFAYAAHCLHTKASVAHTDLHSNNLTIYMWGIADEKARESPEEKVEPFYDDPVVAYVTGPRGEADTFLFPASGISGCIIDYSRVIIGPGYRDRLTKGRSPQYATNFYRDQVNRVMRTLHRYAPEYVAAHENAIKAAVLANFDAVFPILCAVDFIAIGANAGAMLHEESIRVDKEELRPFKVSRVAIALAAQLEKAGREALITGLHDLAETKGRTQEMKTPEFPGDRILKKVFHKWTVSQWHSRDAKRLREVQLVDAYNFNNELRYGSTDYAKYPPWARFDEIEKHLGEYKLTDLFERGIEPFLDALQHGPRVEIIAENLRAEQEKLDGAPVSTDSSWIDE